MKKGKLVYRLLITDKDNKNRKTFGGVAFEGDGGSLNLFLGPGVNINAADQDLYHINLIPAESKKNGT